MTRESLIFFSESKQKLVKNHLTEAEIFTREKDITPKKQSLLYPSIIKKGKKISPTDKEYKHPIHFFSFLPTESSNSRSSSNQQSRKKVKCGVSCCYAVCSEQEERIYNIYKKDLPTLIFVLFHSVFFFHSNIEQSTAQLRTAEHTKSSSSQKEGYFFPPFCFLN